MCSEQNCKSLMGIKEVDAREYEDSSVVLLYEMTPSWLVADVPELGVPYKPHKAIKENDSHQHPIQRDTLG